MPKENEGAIPQDAPAIPDLNDPNLHLDRATAMKAMSARRRQTVLNDMDPDAQAELLAARGPETPPADDDTDAADAAAAAERKRLEEEAAQAAEPAKKSEPAKNDEPVLEPSKQVARQTEEFIDLTDEDLKRIRIRTKVNGEEQLLTGDELRARAQKVAAADDYLTTAKEVLRAARAQPAETATPAAPAAEPPDLSEVDAAIDAVFAGRDDNAKESLKKALLKLQGAQPAYTQQQMREMEQFLVTRSELRQFAKNHPEIVSDQITRRIADEFITQELKASGVDKLEALPADRISEVLETAAARTQPYLPNKSAPAASPGNTATTLSERLKRKSTIDELPAAATRGSSSAPAPRTTLDVLNEMRKARGQPTSGTA